MKNKFCPFMYSLVIILLLSNIFGIQLKAQFIIRGKVLDINTNNPIEFVNISLQGQALGTSTDDTGAFFLKINKDNKTKLAISHLNYKKKILDIEQFSNDSVITILLQDKYETLNNVIVTASLYEQSKEKLTKATAIISQKEIKDNFHSNMIDVLTTIPGITQVWEYHSPIILRGLNSKRLIIMKNGSRRIGTFPGGYFAQDMNIYNIKKIEIIKGPGSVIYGSGAISGIINVIPSNAFGDEILKANIMTGYGSNNNEFLEVANICHKTNNFGIQLNTKYRKTDNMVYGNGTTADNSNIEDRDIALNTSMRLSAQQTLQINADYHYGDWGKPRGFNGSTKTFTKIRNEEDNFHLELSYDYVTEGLLETFSVNMYADNGTRDYYNYKYSEVSNTITSLDLTHYKDLYGGGRIFGLMKLSPQSKLTLGADIYAFRIDNPSDIFDFYNDTQGSISGNKDAGQQDAGLFVLNETKLGEQLKLVAGIRYDYAEVLEGTVKNTDERHESRTAFSGNLGMVFSVNNHTHISLNGGRAFRMPAAEELFTEVISCKGIKQGNPELLPEYSWNIDLGLRGHTDDTRLIYDFALFYNSLDDCITEISSENEDIDFTYTNTNAVIYGGEISTSYRLDNMWKAGNTLVTGLGAAYVYGIDKSGNDDVPLFGMPPFNTKIDLKYHGLVNKHWLTGYNIKLQINYAAEQNRIPTIPEGSDAGPWGYESSEQNSTLNFSLGFNSNTLPGHPKLRFVVKNLLNNSYKPYGSYIPAMGRNFKTTLSITIK